jgi:hypothetical protein
LAIRSFFVSDDLYEGAIVNVETSPTKMDELESGPETHIIADTAFIRALVVGEKSLYMYRYTDGANAKDLFYIRQGNVTELLQFKSYKMDYNGATVVATNKLYANQLAAYLPGCKIVQNKLRTVKYNSQPLKRVFDAYYECTQTNPKFDEKKEKYPLEAGVLLGATRSQISFHSVYPSATNDDLTGQSFSPDLNFTAGFFFDLIRPRNHRKWSFNNELVYTAYTAERTYNKNTSNALAYDYYYTQLKYSYIKLNSMIRFKYPMGKTYIFANAGISNGYMLSGSDYKKHVYRYASYSTDTVIEGHPFTNGISKYEFGLLGGLGIRYNRYALECRFDNSDGMLDYVGLQARVNKTSLLLTYRFTNK